MHQAVVAVTTPVGLKGDFDVDLPLDTATLNERLFAIGLWLIERHNSSSGSHPLGAISSADPCKFSRCGRCKGFPQMLWDTAALIVHQ